MQEFKPIRVMREYDIRGFMAYRADLFTKDKAWSFCFKGEPDQSFNDCVNAYIDKIRSKLGKRVKDVNDLVIPQAPDCDHVFISLEAE